VTPGVVDRARSARASVAVGAARALNGLSRLMGRGSGTVVGGRIGLGIDPSLLSRLVDRRPAALVSGTNGKTTTTAMLVVALAGPECDSVRVATNRTGANMPAGHVAALIDEPDAEAVVLEVDEGYLGELIADTRPRVVVLLNLSRDQLDRISEVRMLVEDWRSSLGGLPEGGGTVVVANADDPMVAWAASTAPDVRWVGAGQVWHEDAVGCPACGGRIRFGSGGDWHCDICRFARPDRSAWLDGDDLVLVGGGRHRMALAIPGGFNRSNAAMVVVAAGAMPPPEGRPPVMPAEALERIGRLAEVAGRYSTVRRHGRQVRLLLAKNPAGWTALFDLLDESGEAGCPVVLSVNARVADGHDPSWLWDVPFERLSGRKVIATGERCRDLAVRLRYAEVEHETVEDPVAALDAILAGTAGSRAVEFLGNYTAFAMLRARL
jgi:UDP-N-acetylmuramyl tripeptide synthase